MKKRNYFYVCTSPRGEKQKREKGIWTSSVSMMMTLNTGPSKPPKKKEKTVITFSRAGSDYGYTNNMHKYCLSPVYHQPRRSHGIRNYQATMIDQVPLCGCSWESLLSQLYFFSLQHVELCNPQVFGYAGPSFPWSCET